MTERSKQKTKMRARESALMRLTDSCRGPNEGNEMQRCSTDSTGLKRPPSDGEKSGVEQLIRAAPLVDAASRAEKMGRKR